MTTDLFAVRGCLAAAIVPNTSSGLVHRSASTADAPTPAVATIVAPERAPQGHREPSPSWLRMARDICAPPALYYGPDIPDGPTAEELNGEIECHLQYLDAHPESHA